MKKFMILLIALIPLLLIGTIEFASVIIKEAYYITAEQIVFPVEYREIVKDTNESVFLSFKAQIYPLEATDKSILYTSSNTSVATVNDDGMVEFVDFGEVEIVAQSLSNTALSTRCKFYVTDSKVHRIELTEYLASVDIGKSFYVKAKIVPSEAIDKNLTYQSSNPEVATVSSVGRVVALAKGQTKITVSAENGVSTSFDLQVRVPVTGLKIFEDQKNIVVGKPYFKFAGYEVLPGDATNQAVEFLSCDESVATISANGDVEFKKAGTCKFVVMTKEGKFADEFSATYTGGYILSAQIAENSLSIKQDFEEGALVNLDINIYPFDAAEQNIVFVSTNSKVVKVNTDNTLSVVGGGTAEIKVFIKKSAKEIVEVGTCQIFIERQCLEIVVASTHIVTDQPEYKLQYQCLPEDHTDQIEFETSSTNTATVSNAGLVSFKGPGQVVVNIKANGTILKEVTVVYTPKDAQLETITKDKQHLSFVYGDRFALSFADNLGIDLQTATFEVVGDSVQYDQDKQAFATTQGGKSQIVIKSADKTIVVEVEVIRYANGIKYQYDTPQTTSKQVVNFEVEVLPDDATTKTVVFEVSDSEVATIDKFGKLTFLKAGSVNVTMTVDNVSEVVCITSTFGELASFDLAFATKTIEDIGERISLVENDFVVYPNDYDFDVSKATISVQNNDIAFVEGTTITGKAKGTTKVYVSIGSVQKSFDLEVKVKSKDVDFVYSGETIDGGKVLGDCIDLDSVIYPINANNQTVSYAVVSGDATIDSQTGFLTFGQADQSVTVSITTQDTMIEKTIVLQKVSSPDSIQVYLGEQNVSGCDYKTTKSLQILPEQDFAIFELELLGVLDAEDIDFSKVETIHNDQYIVVENVGKGLFKVSNSNSNKSIEDSITFVFGMTTCSVVAKFYKLEKITLALDNKDDINFGLERKRVFGTTSYVDGVQLNYMPIEYTLSNNGKEDQLFWFVTPLGKELFASYAPEINYDTDLFSVLKDANGVDCIVAHIANTEKIYAGLDNALTNGLLSGVDFELKVKVVVGNESDLALCTVFDEYIYTFVPAMNIYDANGYNLEGYINKVLQTNFVVTADEVAGDNYVLLQPQMQTYSDGKKKLPPIAGNERYKHVNAIYGNGYILNLNGISDTSAKFLEVYSNVTNVRLKLEKDYPNSNTSSYTRHISTYDVVFSYSIIENMKNIYAAPVTFSTFKNCVIRNTKDYGILLGSEDGYENFNLYVENCVFTNVGQCAINAQNGRVNISGFLDVYNFVSHKNFAEYSSLVESVLKDEAYSNFVYKDGQYPVANVAIAGPPTSFLEASSPNVNEIYFKNPMTGEYEANVDNATGQNYQKLTKTISLGFWILKFDVTANLWLPPKNDRITPTSPVDLSVVYRQI